ncbi:MAG: hypothetical protein U1D66_00950 [Erythrobacter sp.]|nr:hypothetical protein [Erythrobacter sp.]
MSLGSIPEARQFWSVPFEGARTGVAIREKQISRVRNPLKLFSFLRENCDWDDRSRLNVNGSEISLGHPIGTTGVRMMAAIFQRV